MVNNDDNTAKQNISPKTLVCVLLGFFTFSYSLNKQKKKKHYSSNRVRSKLAEQQRNTVVDPIYTNCGQEGCWERPAARLGDVNTTLKTKLVLL